MPAENKWPCPCCGYLIFGEPPGSYDICPICFWEDDETQLIYMRETGANHVSLIEAQRNYATIGACEQRVKPFVRSPLPDEQRDPEWRPVDTEVDDIKDLVPGFDYKRYYPKDSRDLYYWRATYWRRNIP